MSVVAMTRFGRMGRFANQLFQYAYLNGVAKRTRSQLQLPPWVGNQLFGLCNSPINNRLPEFVERSQWSNAQVEPSADEEIVGHDFRGYAQYHTRHLANGCLWGDWAYRDAFRSLFQPVPAIVDRLAEAVSILESLGPVIGVHLRRGDYGRSIFPIIPVDWYLRWLEPHKDKTLFIATETESLLDEFAGWSVVTSKSLGVTLATEPFPTFNYLTHDLETREGWAMDFYPDFHLLSRCSTVIGPSSTYSFAAAMMNPNLDEYWRASLVAEGFEQVDPWDSYPSLREDMKDFKHLEGITTKDNPYWK